MTHFRVHRYVLLLGSAAVTLIVIALAANLRFALVAAISAGAIAGTRTRFAPMAALLLLVAVAILACVAPGSSGQARRSDPASRHSCHIERCARASMRKSNPGRTR